jgi:uncharacterized membrane protein YeaQ/YmgE (transglycosylase-associated protein family)
VSLLVLIVLLAIQGLIVGAFARLALPGRDPLSLFQTMGVGIAGSFIAGLLVYTLSDESEAPSFLAALLCSIAIMYVIRRSRGGGLMSPDRDAAERRRRRPPQY